MYLSSSNCESGKIPSTFKEKITQILEFTMTPAVQRVLLSSNILVMM